MKVYAFIDSQNLNLGIRSLGWRLDFAKFHNYLQTKYNVTRAVLFIGYVPGNEKLYQKLQQAGFVLIFKPVMEVKVAGRKTYKGNVNAELVLHAILELNNYDSAIIVSGDGDFHCLVEYLDKVEKLHKIITPNSKYSLLLRKYAKYIVSLDKMEEKLSQKS